jgi:alpha-beta hydrolase superfamily lysophospholipase
MTNDKINASRAHHSTGQLTGARGLELYYQEWSPAAQETQAVVLLVHGYAEHGGRYARFADDLTAAGYAVGAIDHRGHGRSQGKRVSIVRFDDYTDDLARYAKSLRSRYPEPLPMFVVGHSLGGLIALRWVTRNKPTITGIALSGTAASRPTDVSAALIAVSKILSRVAPELGVVDRPLDKISRDPQVVEDYFNDPLVHAQKIRARLGAEILAAMTTTEQALPSLTEPILILHGGDDTVTDPASSRLINAKVGSEDKTLNIYDGLWHEIFNEPERAMVIGDLTDWLDRQTKGAQ